jgi:hypothetical protein
MAWISFGAGFLLLVLLVADVHSTVFIPRGRAGLLSKRLYRVSWRLWKQLGDRLEGTRRRAFLSWLGPALVPLTVTVWGVLLVLAFALMYAPWVGEFEISPPESGPMPSWALAIYYSGYSAVTLGVGDVTPHGTMPRLMAVAEAGLGFALFTVAVTYLLSVYTARNDSTTLALAISRFVGRRDGEEPVSLLIAVAGSDAQESLNDWMGRIAFDLARLVEARGQYPLLHYFHEPNDDRALSIALTDLLELVTLCLALLDPARCPALAEGPTVKAVGRIGRHYLADFNPPGRHDAEIDEAGRQERYAAARDRLASAGVPLRPHDEAWRRYRAIAREWDVADQRMREWLGYRPLDTVPVNT